MNIGDVAQRSGLPAKTIRYYEEIGLITPLRGANGYRAFRDSDLHKLAFIGRARALGFGGFRATNIFAYRATDPRDMRAATAPEGPQNMAVLREGMAWADTVICAWGTHGAHLGQGARVAAELRKTGQALHHLGLSKAGFPKHPLYIPYAQKPLLWRQDIDV